MTRDDIRVQVWKQAEYGNPTRLLLYTIRKQIAMDLLARYGADELSAEDRRVLDAAAQARIDLQDLAAVAAGQGLSRSFDAEELRLLRCVYGAIQMVCRCVYDRLDSDPYLRIGWSRDAVVSESVFAGETIGDIELYLGADHLPSYAFLDRLMRSHDAMQILQHGFHAVFGEPRGSDFIEELQDAEDDLREEHNALVRFFMADAADGLH
jgi:hypothetical protein